MQSKFVILLLQLLYLGLRKGESFSYSFGLYVHNLEMVLEFG